MISSVDFYFQHSFSSSHFIKYQFSLNQNFYFLLGSIFFAVESDQVRQVRGTGLCPVRSEPLWACLQVEFQFPGPSELLICPSRREYWHKGKDRPLHFAGAISVSPGPCQDALGPFAGPELQSPHHHCPRALLQLWTPPALGPFPVLPHASNTEFKLSTQVKKDHDGLLPP